MPFAPAGRARPRTTATWPGCGRSSFVTSGLTPIPGKGTVYPSLRSTAAWGQLTSDRALVSADRGTIRVPAPQPGTVPNPEGPGRTRRGEGWTLELAPGWRVRTGPRRGDFEVVREPAGTAHP